MKRIRLVAHQCYLGELEPGDLFTHSLEKSSEQGNVAGYLVFLRHNEPVPESDAMTPMLRLEVLDE